MKNQAFNHSIFIVDRKNSSIGRRSQGIKAKNLERHSLTVKAHRNTEYANFKNALNTELRALRRQDKYADQQKQPLAKNSRYLERLEKSAKGLYPKFEKLDLSGLKENLKLSEEMVQVLGKNDKAVKKANILTFFFINFYKDFEHNIIQGRFMAI